MFLWAVAAFLAALLTFGISWLFFPFFANKQHVDYLYKQGYLSDEQTTQYEPVVHQSVVLDPPKKADLQQPYRGPMIGVKCRKCGLMQIARQTCKSCGASLG